MELSGQWKPWPDSSSHYFLTNGYDISTWNPDVHRSPPLESHIQMYLAMTSMWENLGSMLQQGPENGIDAFDFPASQAKPSGLLALISMPSPIAAPKSRPNGDME